MVRVQADVLVANSHQAGPCRAILRDKERYRDPDAFNPSRYLTSEGSLDPNVPDPAETFGFGRRICAGRYFALDAIFPYVSNILAAFTMAKAIDNQGNIIEPTSESFSRLFWYVSDSAKTRPSSAYIDMPVIHTSRFPKPFKASITPRFEGAEELIRMSSVLVE